MKRALVTGGTGIVGRFIVEQFIANDYEVTITGRSRASAEGFSAPVDFVPLVLDPGATFDDITAGFDCLIHAAFAHVPGRYRGGEGEDIAGFWRQNFLATVLLFNAAERTGVKRSVFLSSRAVYGMQKPGAALDEALACHPDTQYGAVKLACERHLQTLSQKSQMSISNLRVTGVYASADGLGKGKWAALFEDYLQGNVIQPRCGGEVHGQDVARAVRLILEHPDRSVRDQIFNVSDLLVDRQDLLAIVKSHTGCKHPLPAAADHGAYNQMTTQKISRYGWKPGGLPLLQSSVVAMLNNT